MCTTPLSVCCFHVDTSRRIDALCQLAISSVTGQQMAVLAINAEDGFEVRAVWTEVYKGVYHTHTGPANGKGVRSNAIINQLSRRCMSGA
jgi:hypothetical protein